MPYPLISDYISSIRAAEDNFDKLSHLRPVMDADGNPVMSSGNFAVVFKMSDGAKYYALKCFLREQEGRDEAYRMIAEELEYVSSPYLTNVEYHDKELFVDSKNCTETEFPVLLMDWVEGMTLDRYIRENIGDADCLKMLAYRFSKLATWLLTQSFAHGDIKPDNILVTSDGSLVLVDYDGMYVPAMSGRRSRELGSPDYRHPLRTEDDFNDHIDDFSLASIALSLKALSLDALLLDRYGAADRLLFSASDYQDLSHCEALRSIASLLADEELARLYALFLIAHSTKNLSSVSFRLFDMKKPKEKTKEYRFEVRNRMSVRALMEQQNADIDIIPSKKNPGKLFFSCGSIVGYITQEAAKAPAKQLQYAECRRDGSTEWVPCILRIPKNNKS